jgi:hypothetical protein
MALALAVGLAACAPAEPDPTAGGGSASEVGDQAKVLVLFTDEEADELRLEPGAEELEALPKGVEGDGPIVELVYPDSLEGLVQPFPLHLSFAPRDAPVDVDTLEVRGKKSLFSRDITDRVRHLFTEEGINVEQVCLATGSFRIEVKISDQQGRETRARYNVDVTGEDEDFCTKFKEAMNR